VENNLAELKSTVDRVMLRKRHRQWFIGDGEDNMID